MIQLVNDKHLQISAAQADSCHFESQLLSKQRPAPFPYPENKTENCRGATTNITRRLSHTPVLPSFVHVFMLLHHDRVSCWDINDVPDREEIVADLLKHHMNYCCIIIIRRHILNLARLWLHDGASYCAVLVRMDVRRACSSVLAEGTLVVIQSVPFGGLLTGFGWGISGLRSSGS